TQPGPITAPAPIRLRAPMLACGPTWASAATSASAATTALAWMPAGASGRASNRAAMRAKAEYGSRATRRGTGQWAASASARTTAAAAVSASSRRYFGLARKLSWPGPAPPRVPTPVIAVVPSPRSSRPNRAARSDRAWACSRAGKAASSEGTAEGELQALDPVAALVLQGHGVADRDRAHRRLPGQRETGRDAQGLGLPVVVTQVDVADVDEGRQPRRRGVEQGREVELQVADRLQRTAQRLPVVAAGEGVGRADRVGLEAAHRVRAADVVVAEERQAALGGAGDDVALGVEGAAVEFVGVAEAVAVADLGTDLHHQPVAQRQVLLVAVVELVVLEVGAGQGNLGIDAVVAATGRHQEVVAGIAHPAGLGAPGVDDPLAAAAANLGVGGGRVAVVVLDRRVRVVVVVPVAAGEEGAIAHGRNQVVDQRWRRGAVQGGDLVAVDAQRELDRVGLGQRDAHDHLAGDHRVVVLGQVGIAAGVLQVAVGEVVAEADPVVGEVGVGVGEGEVAGIAVVLHLQREAVAGAEEVVLHQLDAGDQAVRLLVAQAEGELAGVAFLDVDHHVDQVGRAGHFRRLDVHRLEEAEPLQADLRAVDRRLRIPGAFELAHLPAQHLVGSTGVALEDDSAHLHARARLDEEVDADRARLAVDVRHRGDLGEGVADVAEGGDDGIGGVLDPGPREGVALAQHHQLLDVLQRQHGVAGDLDRGHGVDLALADVGGDEDVALVGADRHLGGLDVEVHVAAVEVEVGQLLQVAGELLARVLVVALVPGQPAGDVGFPGPPQQGFGIGFVADDVDVADLRGLALGDGDGDVDAVAVELGHGRADADAVLAAVVVL